MEYDKLTAEDIVVLDAEGNILDGDRKPSIEYPLHCAVYRRRKDVFGVSHTHSVLLQPGQLAMRIYGSCCGIGSTCRGTGRVCSL